MKIVSPSYKRASGCVSHKLLPGVVYAIQEADVRDYHEHEHDFMVLPDSVKGNMAKVRNAIRAAVGAEDLVMLDDDVRSLRVWGDDGKARALESDEIVRFLENGFEMAREMGAQLWGVNLVEDPGAYRSGNPLSMKRPVLGPFSCICSSNELTYDERLGLKEDYDFFIQNMNRYRVVLRFDRYHYMCGHKTQPGGCSTYRTMVEEESQFAELQRKWGSDIVRADTGRGRVRKRKVSKAEIDPVIFIPIKGV